MQDIAAACGQLVADAIQKAAVSSEDQAMAILATDLGQRDHLEVALLPVAELSVRQHQREVGIQHVDELRVVAHRDDRASPGRERIGDVVA